MPQSQLEPLLSRYLKLHKATHGDMLTDVHKMWKSKRSKLGKPLLKQFWSQTSVQDTNPHHVFRPREKEKYAFRCCEVCARPHAFALPFAGTACASIKKMMSRRSTSCSSYAWSCTAAWNWWSSPACASSRSASCWISRKTSSTKPCTTCLTRAASRTSR